MPCTECGREAIVHVAARCLDRWIHTEFLGLALPANPDDVPLYSSVQAGDPALDALIDARRWPADFRCHVVAGEWTVDSANKRLASERSIALALCRAALTALPRGGNSQLEIFYRLH